MFSREGDARSASQNRLLAGYLALVAGFANSAGFVFLGTFTSHVTGNIGRFANDAASMHAGAALSALSLVVAFYFGAFLGSMMLESSRFGHVSRAYASALVVEAGLLTAFTLMAYFLAAEHPRVLDAEAALLCAAMGMQNALVTRISSAVVRTTHLTGVVTDLGIESARWFRHWRKSLSKATGLPLVMGSNPAAAPDAVKTRLLATIAAAFSLGAVGGAIAAARVGHAAMLVPVFAIALCAALALRTGRMHDATMAQLSRR